MGIKTTYICDRCGKKSSAKRETMVQCEFFGDIGDIEDFEDLPGNDSIILCRSCYEEFKLWLQKSDNFVKAVTR